MEFSIKGIGIIKEADIKVDGLTVIAGANNSGKTTVGRALYAVTSAAENLDAKQETDRAAAITTRIRKILVPFSEWLGRYRNYIAHHQEIPDKFLNELLEVQYWFAEGKLDYYIDLLFRLCQSIEDASFIDILVKNTNNIMEDSENSLRNAWESNRDKLLSECAKARAFVESFQTQPKREFAYKLIEKTLQVEFTSQIQSFNMIAKSQASTISLENNQKEYYKILMEENKILPEKSDFMEACYDRVYFIDDPYIMEDQIASSYFISPHSQEGYIQARIGSHREKMRRMMRDSDSDIDEGISEAIYREKALENVMAQINKIVPGKVTQGVYQTSSGMKLNVGNLATGSKIFSIIKKILSSGDFTDKTLLILDEPESHLHPSWINQLAEVIVVLVKECNITVLLTTHSPNFLLAVDALMRKYDIREKCHFYQTEQDDDNYIKYVERTDCLDNIYADFAASFAEMNALRKKYMNREE